MFSKSNEHIQLTQIVYKSYLISVITFRPLPYSRIVHLLFVSLGICTHVHRIYLLIIRLSSPEFTFLRTCRELIFTLWVTFTSFVPFVLDLNQFFQQFDSIWTGIMFSKASVCSKFLQKELFYANCAQYCMVNSIIAFSIVIFYSINSRNELSFMACLDFTTTTYGYLLIIGYIYVLLLSVALLTAAYKSIEQRLISIELSGHGVCLGGLRICRNCHIQLNNLIDLISSTFSVVFSILISYFVPSFISGCYELAFNTHNLITLTIILIWTLVTMLQLIITFNTLIKLNLLPQSYYLSLYRTTLNSIENSVKDEACFYLNILSRNDVGFKLWNYFLVTSDLFPTLIAVIYSYLIAVGNFFQD